MDSEIDWTALEAIKGDDLSSISMEGLPRKYKTKTVNLCPYCRALVGAIATAPFLFLWKLYPHKPKPPMTREQVRKNSRRRTWYSLGVGAGINIAIGLWKIVIDDWTGLIQIIVGTVMITAVYWGPSILKMILYMSRLVPKRKLRTKVQKEHKPREPPAFIKKIQSKHDVICPPIFFIEKQKDGDLK